MNQLQKKYDVITQADEDHLVRAAESVIINRTTFKDKCKNCNTFHFITCSLSDVYDYCDWRQTLLPHACIRK